MSSKRFPEAADLFGGAAPPPRRGRLYSIAPHAPFLTTLADKILDGTLLGDWPRTGAFWLSDVTIILPTRRARLALAEAFLERGHALLPDIRTIGGEQTDEEPFLPPYDLPALASPVGATERRLALATLIEAWAKTERGGTVLATPPNAAEILSLADSLGELIDDLAIEEIPFSRMRNLPPEALDDSWQEILEFLKIAFEAWPAMLAERGLADAATLRNERLRRQAGAAQLIFGERPVIAAGSTGSIPATATLLKAIATLPRGVLVLPGLDTSLSAKQHAVLLVDDGVPHGHSQYGLAKLLRRLGAGPGEVIELAPAASPRTKLVREALSLAEDTAGWIEARAKLAPDLNGAASGLSVIAARTADEEARAVALCARDAIGQGRTVGIISPDQNLSRRIAAELLRFGIEVDDPAGTPLFQSPAGRIARVILALHESDFAPVNLVALLRNKATTFGLERAEVRRLANRIENGLLRGQRLKPGLVGLREVLVADQAREKPRLKAEDGLAAADLFNRLEAAMAPLAEAAQKSTSLAQKVLAAFEQVTAVSSGSAVDSVPGSDVLLSWAEDLAAHAGEGPALPRSGLDNVLFSLMQGYVVRPKERRRDDIFIWGLLEARLQSPDLLILAGLNEDIWPQAADAGPWLSRGMRLELGLEPPERRQGQAAHDFEMAVGNAAAVLALAERMGTAPALPSRLLQRLEAFLGPDVSREMRARGKAWLDAASAVDASTQLLRAARPEPKPAVGDRPRKLSVTEIETLIRSPYEIYAKHILRLRKMAPLGELPDARDRGTIVHDIFASFVSEGHNLMAPDAFEKLSAYAVKAFSALDVIGERRDIWLHRFAVAARQFLDFERARNIRIERRYAEIDGMLALANGFELIGRADRVDYLSDGSAEILDFKTGGIPQPPEMTEFLAPQLPLEALMLKHGAFRDLAPAEASALTYIKIGLGPEAFNLHPFRVREGSDVLEAAAEMGKRLEAHTSALLLDDKLPMTARVFPKPDPQRRYLGDYDHLGRNDEWSVTEGDESE